MSSAHRAPGSEPESHTLSPPIIDAAEDSRQIDAARAHPLRDDLLNVLTSEGSATIARLAQATGAPVDTVAEHVRVLEEAKAVERVERPGGGEVAYRPTVRPVFTDEQWAQLPLDLRRELFRGDLDRIERHARAALATGGFDRTDAHVSIVPTSLDAEGHAAMSELLVETVERAMAIQAGSDARRPAGVPREDELKSEVVVLHFLRSPAGADQVAPATLERMYELHDELTEELPGESPDWQRVAACAREMGELAAQHAPAVH